MSHLTTPTLESPRPSVIRVERGALWAIDLRSAPDLAAQPPAPPGYRVREIRRCRDALALCPPELGPELGIVQRYEEGRRLFAVDQGGLFVAWAWMTYAPEWAPPLARELRFAADECYSYGAETVREHQGHGLLTVLQRRIAAVARAEGAVALWGGILDSNVASQRSCRKAGYQPVLRLMALHAGRRALVHSWPAQYAEPRLLARARRLLATAQDQNQVVASAIVRSQAVR